MEKQVIDDEYVIRAGFKAYFYSLGTFLNREIDFRKQDSYDSIIYKTDLTDNRVSTLMEAKTKKVRSMF